MFCIWCQSSITPKNLREKGFSWIHLECFINIINLKQDIEAIIEILNKERDENISEFIKRMKEFDFHAKEEIRKVLGVKS